MAHPIRARRAVLTLTLALAGCGSLPGALPPGTTIDSARHSGLGPTQEYRLANGGTRLEFDQGKQTYMLDFDPSGALVGSQQVLTEANLGSVAPGMSAAEVRMRYGRPAWIYGIGYQRRHVWNYRFDGGDCVWYQISIDDAAGLVVDSNLGQDPACDGPSKHF
ncbi:MAG: hypothetical protein M3O01_11445 [Pseudomonadota bacterium]|nr:hypothetical protein [Pseudomonadota bacterium]